MTLKDKLKKFVMGPDKNLAKQKQLQAFSKDQAIKASQIRAGVDEFKMGFIGNRKATKSEKAQIRAFEKELKKEFDRKPQKQDPFKSLDDAFESFDKAFGGVGPTKTNNPGRSARSTKKKVRMSFDPPKETFKRPTALNDPWGKDIF